MRELHLINKAINKFNLNLNGLTVFTEAASGNYLYTPIIAGMSGAKKVYAVTTDSRYGKAEKIKEETLSLCLKLGLPQIEILYKKTEQAISESDIITNTGFVRPIDKKMVSKMKQGAVIPLMFESWEFRKKDIDLTACREKGITIIGTNERHLLLQTFKYVAITVLKLLLENNIEVFDTNILVVGSSFFLEETVNILKVNGAKVSISNTSSSIKTPSLASDHLDAIVFVEHLNNICLLGENGVLNNDFPFTGDELMIHICGNIDPLFAASKGRTLIPKSPEKFGYMSYTTDYIGVKPVIDLHTAGLKVAEMYLRSQEDPLSCTQNDLIECLL